MNHKRLWAAPVVWTALLSAGCPGPGGTAFLPPGATVVFRDEFDAESLQAGWIVVGKEVSDGGLTTPEGFLRLVVDPPVGDALQTQYALLLREEFGDFVLSTRMAFDPQADRHVAGLIIEGDDGRRVSFGLLKAAGSRGSFRGLVPIVDEPKVLDLDRTVLAYEESEVYLRVQRTQDRFELAYSTDGETFIRVGTVTTNLSEAVRVGVGAASDADCNSDCDSIRPADFDFFEIDRSVR